MVHHGGRGDGQLHRQMGRQRLVGLGLGGGRLAVSALAVIGTNLYAGGLFTTAGGVSATNIAKWDGSAWSALGSGLDSSPLVYALAAVGTDLYVGGGFTTSGGMTVNRIAKWDGSAWSALGSGVKYTTGASPPYTPPRAASSPEARFDSAGA